MKINWAKSTVLITGGTGSFGKAFTKYLLSQKQKPVIRIFSRDEFKQYQMQNELKAQLKNLRFLLGDVRDNQRLEMAMRGVDIVIHAAALKHVPLGEYNPYEPVKTNILGTQNVAESCLKNQVKLAVLISSDKAAYPINLYGATKLCAERLFIQSNVYKGARKCSFLVVRYGNVLGSRGSVVPLFKRQKQNGKITITDDKMTRFWITLPQACKFVQKCLQMAQGGEIFVPKLPSVKISDLAKAIAPKAKLISCGIRPGEKVHETLVTEEESSRTKAFKDYFVISPQYPYWTQISKKRGRSKKPFVYDSGSNKMWLKNGELKKLLENDEKV